MAVVIHLLLVSGWWLFVVWHQQPTTNNQQPTINNQQPTTNNQQSTTNKFPLTLDTQKRYNQNLLSKVKL
ncbi:MULTISPECIES: hypothetical protein [Fischerella]|uniref:hypothetical protein n=1 Tax=Fischerella TaxID=1190 RepID=UPI0002E4FA4F|nr:MULTISPECIES: hypothetical protein [Fischerella]MBD2430369.1 hypothetical protein [Fischerella sp. FACHB-380]